MIELMKADPFMTMVIVSIVSGAVVSIVKTIVKSKGRKDA